MKHNWEYKTWNEVIRIYNGKNQRAVENPNGEYPIYGSGGIMNYADDYICPENCTIIGRKGNINKPIFVSTKFWNVDTAFGLSPSKSIHPKFLYYFCVTYDFEKHNKAITIPSLIKKDLLKINFPVPPMEVQEQIVTELDKISEVIEDCRELLRNLDALAQSLFYDYFGDPISNPKGWPAKSLTEVCTVTSSNRIFAEEYCEEGIPFYRGKEISELSRGENISIELFISTQRYEKLKESNNVPLINDILITAVGTIGNIWVVDTNKPFYFKDGNIIWLKDIDFGKSNSISFCYMLSKLIESEKNKIANGSAYKALTIQNLKKTPIYLPPLSLQEKFATRIEMIDAQKKVVEQTIDEMQTLLDSRMDYWFN